MATFIEVLCPGEQRQYVRVNAIERVEAPKGLAQGEIASPEAPMLLHLRNGSVVPVFGQSPLLLLTAMLHGDNVKVAMADGPYEAMD
jgi:hypothetical protein